MTCYLFTVLEMHYACIRSQNESELSQPFTLRMRPPLTLLHSYLLESISFSPPSACAEQNTEAKQLYKH